MFIAIASLLLSSRTVTLSLAYSFINTFLLLGYAEVLCFCFILSKKLPLSVRQYPFASSVKQAIWIKFLQHVSIVQCWSSVVYDMPTRVHFFRLRSAAILPIELPVAILMN